MNHELLADLWNVTADRIPEKYKADVAQEFVTTLLDYGINESVIEQLTGIDTYLDTAIEYAVDEDSDEEWEDE
jgi:hypothetical protein